MMRLVTLLAVADIPIGLFVSEEGISSTGDVNGFSPEELFLPKVSFHFDGFLVTTGSARIAGTGGKLVGSTAKSLRCFDEDRDALLISRARACDAVTSISSLSSVGEPGVCARGVGTPAPLPFLAPRLRRLCVDVDRESIPSPSCSSNPWSKTVDNSDASLS